MIGALFLLAVGASAQAIGLEAVVHEMDGERVCTVHARHERIEAVVQSLASQSGLTL